MLTRTYSIQPISSSVFFLTFKSRSIFDCTVKKKQHFLSYKYFTAVKLFINNVQVTENCCCSARGDNYHIIYQPGGN